MTKHVGLIGKVGPLFAVENSTLGSIEIADNDNDQTWIMPIPGGYFNSPQSECLRAAFDHLITNEDN